MDIPERIDNVKKSDWYYLLVIKKIIWNLVTKFWWKNKKHNLIGFNDSYCNY